MPIYKDIPKLITATVAGSIVGAKSISFYVQSDNATIDGQPVTRDLSISWSSTQNTGLAELAYDPGTGTLVIAVVY